MCQCNQRIRPALPGQVTDGRPGGQQIAGCGLRIQGGFPGHPAGMAAASQILCLAGTADPGTGRFSADPAEIAAGFAAAFKADPMIRAAVFLCKAGREYQQAGYPEHCKQSLHTSPSKDIFRKRSCPGDSPSWILIRIMVYLLYLPKNGFTSKENSRTVVRLWETKRGITRGALP